MHINNEEARRLPRNRFSFYHECRQALRVFYRVKTGLSDAVVRSKESIKSYFSSGGYLRRLEEEFSVSKE